MKSTSILYACLLLIAVPMPAFGDSFADNWHQWRGPDANGVSTTADPPVSWSEDENVKWKVAIEGQGTSTPIIWGDKVFVLTATNTGVKDPSIPDPEDQPKTNFFDIKQPNAQHAFVVLCLDRNTGKEKWRQVATTKIPHEGGSVRLDSFAMTCKETKSGKRNSAKPKSGPVLAKAAHPFYIKASWSLSVITQVKAQSKHSMPRQAIHFGNATETKATHGPHHESSNIVAKHKSLLLLRVLYAVTISTRVTSSGNAVV